MNINVYHLCSRRQGWLMLRLIVIATILLVLSARVMAQSVSPKAVLGARVKLSLGGEMRTGELLAASADSIWIMDNSQVVGFARSNVRAIKYRRHNFTPQRALVAGAVVTTATTVAFGAACSQYQQTTEGAGVLCGNAVGSWFGISASLTGITALWTALRSWPSFSLTKWDQLSAYARFPQGLPASMRSTE